MGFPPALQAGQWGFYMVSGAFFRRSINQNNLTGYDYHQKNHLPG
jgi:hypothetical protein